MVSPGAPSLTIGRQGRCLMTSGVNRPRPSGPGSPGTRSTELSSLGATALGIQELPGLSNPGKAGLMFPHFLA